MGEQVAAGSKENRAYAFLDRTGFRQEGRPAWHWELTYISREVLFA